MKIPFEVVGGIIMLDVCVNGKEGKMAFDTGVCRHVLTRIILRILKERRKKFLSLTVQ